MKLIEEVIKLSDIKIIQNEIDERIKFLKLVLGNRYPTIIINEIETLREHITSLEES